MKTTFDLPEELVNEVKKRAVEQGRQPNDVAAELLRLGIEMASHSETVSLGKDPNTGLPVVIDPHSISSRNQLSPDDLANILLDQEVAWHQAAGRK